MKIIDNITQAIGNTPLVRINHLKAEQVNVFAKVESFNPGGSVKDRVALNIIDYAEQTGMLQPGGTIIEASSGNTGVALALVGAARGYRVIITMPESMSKERRALMKAYGAELVLTPGSEGMKGTLEAANEILSQTENAILANQFANPANQKAHQTYTAPEIWNALSGKVDAIIAGIGTGGTITGIGQTLKSMNPDLKVFGVEPAESPLLSEGKAGPHKIQGIGANFVPEILNQKIIDELFLVPGDKAIEMARQAAKKEGLLVGISAGAALYATQEISKRPEWVGKNLVTILPDTGERYLSTPLFADLLD